MTSYFSSEFFSSNRKKLQKLINADSPTVIAGHGLLQRNSDMAMPFRQDSSFWYLTGIDEPDMLLVLDEGKEYLIVPERDAVRQAFDGSLQLDYLSSRSGIQTIYESSEGWAKLAKRIKQTGKISGLRPPEIHVEHFDFYTNPARRALMGKVEDIYPDCELQDIREALVELRSIKQPEEIIAIQASIDLTVGTLKKLPKKLQNMQHEYEAEAFITHAFRSKSAVHGYSPIVASGFNACTLHYDRNNSPLDRSAPLLVDVGAEFEYYSADITRVFAVDPPTPRQQAVADAVVDVQDYALSLLKPGATIKENEKLVETYMGEKLRELGVIGENTKEHVRQYYPHATSHFLGLDVHDIGNYEAPLQPGMVLTVEPGIYIPDENLGVRIEDNILITKIGHKLLSKKLPRNLL